MWREALFGFPGKGSRPSGHLAAEAKMAVGGGVTVGYHRREGTTIWKGGKRGNSEVAGERNTLLHSPLQGNPPLP